MNQSKYIFTSQRLGFRNWNDTDLIPMFEINADKDVMEFFPSTQTFEQTQKFVELMKIEFSEKGYCYFAVDILETSEFIGFVGLHQQNFEADFTPCVDIGWRLSKKYWLKGYATEGAKACLQYAFAKLKLFQVVAMAPVVNVKSQNVMKKIGMNYVKNFMHPALINTSHLKDCVLYELNLSEY